MGCGVFLGSKLQSGVEERVFSSFILFLVLWVLNAPSSRVGLPCCIFVLLGVQVGRTILPGKNDRPAAAIVFFWFRCLILFRSSGFGGPAQTIGSARSLFQF